MSDLNSETNHLFSRRQAMRPTFQTWLKHLFLLGLTFCTTTLAGTLEPFGRLRFFPNVSLDTTSEVVEFLFSLPFQYAKFIASTIQHLYAHPDELVYGLEFSVSLLMILTAHEAGHYVACRIYKVDATLPFFVPTPPLLGPAGTMGAFIKILSPLPSRRATFDIGVAGPIAGFIVIIPVAVIGLATMQTIPPEIAANMPAPELVFSDPLLLKILAYFLGVNLNLVFMNPFYAAAWVGLLVTSLNLIPSGQLDGGHAVYAIFGERFHKWSGRIAFVAMVAISMFGCFFYSSPSGILFTILLGVMLRIKHPEPYDKAPLDAKRMLVAVLTLIIFALCFVPFPIQIN